MFTKTRLTCLLLSVLVVSPTVAQTQDVACGDSGDVSVALHMLPPLGADFVDPEQLDSSLTEFLAVTVLDPGGAVLAEFTSEPQGHDLDYVKLQDGHYHVNWHITEGEVGLDCTISIAVAGLELGQAAHTPNAPDALPIRFDVDRNPRILARVMHEQGYSALEIAEALVAGFDVPVQLAANILYDENFTALETYLVLEPVFGVTDVIEAEHILFCAGYSPDEYLEFTALEWVNRFAPVLRFDGSHKGLPMSAQAYFDRIMDPYLFEEAGENYVMWVARTDGPHELCGFYDCSQGMQNNDPNALINGQVPTYFKVISDITDGDEGRLRIAYWWYYGWQAPCNTSLVGQNDGAHHGDWEHVMVTTSSDRSAIDAVTYYQHKGHYTRQDFAAYGERPVVYVGKTAHGSYHGQEHSGDMAGSAWYCCYYNDYRNPSSPQDTWFVSPLVSLRGNSEWWMLADRIGGTILIGGESRTIRNWLWGPDHRWCDEGTKHVCSKWAVTPGIGTHPTIRSLDWNMTSCEDQGCSLRNSDDKKSRGCYLSDDSYEQGWPWSSSNRALRTVPDETRPALGADQVARIVQQQEGLRAALAAMVADAMDMPADELRRAIDDGRSLHRIAVDRGLNLDEVFERCASEVPRRLELAVETGLLDSCTAERIGARLADPGFVVSTLERYAAHFLTNNDELGVALVEVLARSDYVEDLEGGDVARAMKKRLGYAGRPAASKAALFHRLDLGEVRGPFRPEALDPAESPGMAGLASGDIALARGGSPHAFGVAMALEEFCFYGHVGVLALEDGRFWIYESWPNLDASAASADVVSRLRGTVWRIPFSDFARRYETVEIVRLPDAARNASIAPGAHATLGEGIVFDPHDDPNDLALSCSEYVIDVVNRKAGYDLDLRRVALKSDPSLRRLATALGFRTESFAVPDAFAEVPGARSVGTISRYPTPSAALARRLADEFLYQHFRKTGKLGNYLAFELQGYLRYRRNVQDFVKWSQGYFRQLRITDPESIRRDLKIMAPVFFREVEHSPEPRRVQPRDRKKVAPNRPAR